MKNYIEYFYNGGQVKDEFLLRLDDDPNKGALIGGDLKVALETFKNVIQNIKLKYQKYDKIKKVVSKTPQTNTTSSNNKIDVGTVIASVGYIDNPFKTDRPTVTTGPDSGL